MASWSAMNVDDAALHALHHFPGGRLDFSDRLYRRRFSILPAAEAGSYGPAAYEVTQRRCDQA
jgi:hypothetical protein